MPAPVGNHNARKHGLSGTRLHIIRNGMLARCYNPNSGRWDDYGARGISVCARWRKSITYFLEDMGHPPSSLHTLDRIDGDGNYEPGNCRWADPDTQAGNKRNTHKITFRGETHHAAAWARKIGLSPKCLNLRLVRRGWSIERSLTTPLQSNQHV